MNIRTLLKITPFMLLLSFVISPMSVSFAEEKPADATTGTDKPAEKSNEEPDC